MPCHLSGIFIKGVTRTEAFFTFPALAFGLSMFNPLPANSLQYLSNVMICFVNGPLNTLSFSSGLINLKSFFSTSSHLLTTLDTIFHAFIHSIIYSLHCCTHITVLKYTFITFFSSSLLKLTSTSIFLMDVTELER